MGSVVESEGKDRLAALTAQVRRDLARIAHPSMPWLEPRIGSDGKPALDVLITGAGPIGIMAAGIAKHVGARHVVVTDVNDYRLGLAKKLGATRTVNVSKEALSDVQKELCMTEGFDVGLEMSGAPGALKDMVDNMSHGGKISMLGIPSGEVSVDWNKVVFIMLTIKGIYGREIFETWYKMTVMVQSGLDLSPIITHRLPYREFEAGFDAMLGGKSGKVILRWD